MCPQCWEAWEHRPWPLAQTRRKTYLFTFCTSLVSYTISTMAGNLHPPFWYAATNGQNHWPILPLRLHWIGPFDWSIKMWRKTRVSTPTAVQLSPARLIVCTVSNRIVLETTVKVRKFSMLWTSDKDTGDKNGEGHGLDVEAYSDR